MAIPEADKLRQLLGESIPEGGQAEDTLFSAEEIAQLLTDANGDRNRAAYAGWQIKAAHFANLVNTTEGNASRAMSDLSKQALDMVKMFARSASGSTDGRTTLGRLRRRES